MSPPISFNPALTPDQIAELTRLLGEVDEFKGHWRKLGEIRAERLASLRQVTTIESAGSSTRIEGAQLSDDEVARVLHGLRVDGFRPAEEFKEEMDEMFRVIRSSKKLPGMERIYVHGELEWEAERDHIANGIPLDVPTYEALEGISKDLGIPLNVKR